MLIKNNSTLVDKIIPIMFIKILETMGHKKREREQLRRHHGIASHIHIKKIGYNDMLWRNKKVMLEKCMNGAMKKGALWLFKAPWRILFGYGREWP